jgi:Zn-dependent protease
MRASGAAVCVSPAFVVAALFLLLLMAVGNGLDAGAFAEAGAVVGIYVVSVFLHETAHARAARRFGMDVEGITLSLAGGVTRYSGADPGPRALRAIALAGLAWSAALATAGLLIALVTWAAGWRGGLGSLAMWTAQVNLGLALVNLLPFGTLDGAMIRAAGRRLRAPRSSPS